MQHQILYLLMRKCALSQVVLWEAEPGKGLRPMYVQKIYGNKVKVLIDVAELKAFLGAK